MSRAIGGDSTESSIDDARSRIAQECRAIAARGVAVGGAGNASERLDDRILITRSGLRFETAEPEDISTISLDGRLLEGAKPSTETQLHAGIYRQTDSRAIMHIHGAASVAVGLVEDEVPPVHYNILRLGGHVPTVPFAPFGSVDLAQSVSAAMADGAKAVLMRNHGSISRGGCLTEAVEFIEMTEWLCNVYLSARGLGHPALLGLDVLKDLAERTTTSGYGRVQ